MPPYKCNISYLFFFSIRNPDFSTNTGSLTMWMLLFFDEIIVWECPRHNFSVILSLLLFMILETSHLSITRWPRTKILNRFIRFSVGVTFKTSINIHYFLCVMSHLLICTGIEFNPAPKILPLIVLLLVITMFVVFTQNLMSLLLKC